MSRTFALACRAARDLRERGLVPLIREDMYEAARKLQEEKRFKGEDLMAEFPYGLGIARSLNGMGLGHLVEKANTRVVRETYNGQPAGEVTWAPEWACILAWTYALFLIEPTIPPDVVAYFHRAADDPGLQRAIIAAHALDGEHGVRILRDAQ